MKPKTMILMVLAVVCGLAASYMTSRVLADRNQPAGPEEEKVVVLVAKQKVPMGTLIKDPQKYFVEKTYTKGEEPRKAIKSWDQLKDKRLNKPLSEEQFVTGEELLDPKGYGGIEYLLPQGMRGIAIKVNSASSAAGFVLPNSRVDVVQTLRFGENSTTKTILQNMLVLATDAIKDRPDDKGNILASTVTLAAKPEDVQKLRLAEGIGELSLSLRGSEDETIVVLKETKPKDLSRSGNTDAGPGGDEAGSEAGGSSAINRLPEPPPVAQVPVVEKKEEAPPPKTITQLLYNGETPTKTIFVLKEGEVTTQVEKTGLEREPRPEKKEPTARPEAEPKGKAERGPTDAAKKDGDPAPRPESGK